MTVYIPIMSNKKVFSTSIERCCIKALKHLSVDTDKSLGRLLEEAIRDLVEKYRKEMNSKETA
jgi:hypothetical protein